MAFSFRNRSDQSNCTRFTVNDDSGSLKLTFVFLKCFLLADVRCIIM